MESYHRLTLMEREELLRGSVNSAQYVSPLCPPY